MVLVHIYFTIAGFFQEKKMEILFDFQIYLLTTFTKGVFLQPLSTDQRLEGLKNPRAIEVLQEQGEGGVNQK